MTTRREMLLVFVGGALAAPLGAFAQQQPKIARVGFFYFGSRQSAQETGRYAAFIEGMRDLGYVEGKDFVIEARFADGKLERLPGLAAELVRLKVDVIVATGSPVNLALKRATTSVPVVIAVSADPIREGLAASLARPQGNFTGLTYFQTELNDKQIELLIAAVPSLSRIAVLMNSSSPSHPWQLKGIQTATQKVGVEALAFDGRTSEKIAHAFASMKRDRVQAVLILGDAFLLQQSGQIAALALTHRLPSIYLTHEFADAGGLMSYGPNITANFRHVASYVDKILKGTKAGDLPIEQATTFQLIINRKTAKTIGITIPQSILLRADQVIE